MGIEKIKKYKWRIFLVGDLVWVWQILHMYVHIEYVDLDDFRCGGSWATKLWEFIGKGIHRTATQGEHFHLDIDFLLPFYLLGFTIFLLGILVVKAWQEQKKEILERKR